MPDESIAFLIYTALFRLSVIATGGVFVYLGYRLFVLGVMPRDGSEIDAQGGNVRLSVKNAAPGTCFALFGAAMIAIMLLQGNPEHIREQRHSDGGATTSEYRGDTGVGLRGTLVQPDQTADDIDDAIERHSSDLAEATSLDQVTLSIAGLAAAYVANEDGVDTKRTAKSLALTEVVFQLDPNNASNLATMARARWHLDERDGAIAAMTEAARLDRRFAEDLGRMKEGDL